MRSLFLALVGIFIFSSCVDDFDDTAEPWRPGSGNVYIPVYGDPETAHEITVEDAKPIENPAKIFTYNQYLIVNIRNEGFHVIDNTNPAIPRQLYFISVPGSQDVAIKDGYIYTDNYSDIVAFTIDENQNLEILKRLEGIMGSQDYPPFRGVYFECVDPEKGIVIDWVVGEVENPNCYRP